MERLGICGMGRGRGVGWLPYPGNVPVTSIANYRKGLHGKAG